MSGRKTFNHNETNERRQEMANEILMMCPDCQTPMELLARGKQKRLFGCARCTGDKESPRLWYQPVSLLPALRKLEQGPLVEANNKPAAVAQKN
jgi:hypothetical protein